MRGTVIPTIRVTTLMLGMGDTPITRALANNNAVTSNSVQIKVIVTYSSYNVRLVTRLWNVRGTKQKQIPGSVKGDLLENVHTDSGNLPRSVSEYKPYSSDKDKWQAPVNVVVNLQVPQNADNFLTEDLVASQEGFCSMELFGLLLG